MQTKVRKKILDSTLVFLFAIALAIALIGTYGVLFRGGLQNIFPWSVGAVLYALSLGLIVVVPGVWLVFRGRGSALRIGPAGRGT